MPRQGPKKLTKRDERDLDRKTNLTQLKTAEGRTALQEKVLNTYKLQRNPNIPKTKCEQRALRAALTAEGASMSVWCSGEDLSPFANIARERFVNTKYAIPADDYTEDFETDPWLQMFMHVPEEYRQEVSEKAPAVKSLTLKIDPSATPVAKQERKKMSRRKAQAAAAARASGETTEGTEAGPETHSAVDTGKTLPSTDVATATAVADTAQAAVPQGKVVVRNASGLSLTADAAGKLTWDSAEPSSWTLFPADDGKFTLRSQHGKYLSHCLFNWGLIADRTSASDWEKFAIKSAKPTAESEEVVFSLQSWRGLFVTAEDGKVGLALSAEARGAQLKICAV